MLKLKIWALALAGAFIVSNAQAVDVTESFGANPLTNGWQIYGDTSLFQWDATNQQLDVTWDSSQTNSYFYHPLGATFNSDDTFSLAFDLFLNDADIEGGTFEIAVGLLNFTNATNPGFLRGTGYNTTNQVEFDFFLDPVYGNSLGATEIDSNGFFADVYDYAGFDTNTTYHVTITHASGAQLISAQVSVGGQVYSTLPYSYVETGFANFYVDTLAIPNYDATGSYVDSGTNGVSLLAHGTVANLVLTASQAPVGTITGQLVGQTWQAQFRSLTNWVYVLQRSTDLQSWSAVTGSVNGTGSQLTLQDTNAPTAQAFYRVLAQPYQQIISD